jgi:CRP-like cAMP-binding protein
MQLQGPAQRGKADHFLSDSRRLCRSVMLRTADHSFSALTDAVVCSAEGSHILKSVTEFPRLGAALLWAASRDEAMVVEHLVSIGRRNAIERTAHFFMKLAERLSLIEFTNETEFKCPLSQFVIADALGLTAIHVNRVLRDLRVGPAHRAQGQRQNP